MFTRFQRAMATLSACAMLVFLAVWAYASTLIYLYEGGQPVQCTTCSYQGPHVYKNGNLVGDVNAQNNIIDGNQNVVGYIRQSGSGGIK